MARRTRLAATAAVAGAIALTGAGVAHAGITGKITAAQSARTATWGATPLDSDGAGAPALSWSFLDGLAGAPKYFRVTNTGGTTLTGTTFTFVVARTGSNGSVPGVRFEVCLNGSFSGSTCSAGAAAIKTVATTSDRDPVTVDSTTYVPPAPAAFLSMRAVPTVISINQGFFATVTTTVSSSTQIRGDLVSNS